MRRNFNTTQYLSFFGRNSFKNYRTRVVEFPSPILVEYRSSWPKFFQTGRKPTMGRISANLDDIRPKSVAGIKLRAFDRF
jgi:hypothetical protein